MKKKVAMVVAKKVVTVLDSVLKMEANSTSCCLAYQPKEPKKLEKFKRIKK